MKQIIPSNPKISQLRCDTPTLQVCQHSTKSIKFMSHCLDYRISEYAHMHVISYEAHVHTQKTYWPESSSRACSRNTLLRCQIPNLNAWHPGVSIFVTWVVGFCFIFPENKGSFLAVFLLVLFESRGKVGKNVL